MSLAILLLMPGCDGTQESPVAMDPEIARYRAGQERQSLEERVRLSVYHQCGGDREPRCKQFAPRDLSGVEPSIALRGLSCRETGVHNRRVRDCAFALGREGGMTCRVTLRERSGNHSFYWSDEVETAPATKAEPSQGVQVPIRESSLACSGPLLALTEEPEAARRASR
jgi:hypothetical protein